MLANVAGSVTTYSVQNPSYMIIELDQETMLPVNMFTYAMDIAKANKEGTPTWELIHDYKETYGLKDLSPKSMLELSERIRDDFDTAAEFDWNLHAQHGKKPTSADQINQKELYCQVSTSEMWENHDCMIGDANTVRPKYGQGFSMYELQGGVDWLVNDWIDVSLAP